jgi:signal transduction histidine kinase/CheY-like chemotaxis protein/HPt (histidine-containing phosphotransfer) domain-containing protein
MSAAGSNIIAGIKKIFSSRLPYLQVLFVFLAFGMVTFASYMFGVNTERNHLEHEAEVIAEYKHAQLSAALREKETMLGIVSETIRKMIMDGADFVEVQEYMTDMTDYGLSVEYLAGFTDIFGMFDAFGNQSFHGSRPDFDWSAMAYWRPERRPWFRAAAESSGEIVLTAPFINELTREVEYTYVRNIYGDDGGRLAVICIDVLLSRIYSFPELGYGQFASDWMLFCADLNIIAHHNPDFLGKPLKDVPGGLSEIAGYLELGFSVSGRTIINHEGEAQLISVRQLDHGWYLGVTTLVDGYLRNLNNLQRFLAGLGLLMASLLSAILVHIAAQRNRAENRTKKLLLEAETANHTKSAFLANMSHEIRTPMNSIIGFSELAQYGDIPAKTKEYLRNIQNSAEWLLKIINDILDISKIESGKIALEHIPFDLHDIIADCRSSIRPVAMEKGIILECCTEPEINRKLLGDPVRVRQILTNLLSNAVKFTDVGAVKFSAAVAYSSENSMTIRFEVNDSGIGMTPGQLEKVFEPFIQADDSVTRKFGGTGLGLPITKSIIEMMGGELGVESMLGFGTRFNFTLAFDLAGEHTAVHKAVPLGLEKPSFSGEILICEDNSLNRQVICDHLERVGLKTVVAANGEDGVALVSERRKKGARPFDLILMDIHMPVMDGLEAASKITSMRIKTPVVAMTANIMSNDVERYKNSGMYDHIGKPFTSQELWSCLAKYLPVIKPEKSEKYSESESESEDDKKLKKFLQTEFARNSQDIYGEIVKSFGDGDIKLAHRLAHTLKSNAGQIGEKRLAEAAAETETALSEILENPEEQILFFDRQLSVLSAEIESALAGLAPLLNGSEAKDKDITPACADKIREIIERLEPLLKNKNPECEDMLDEIRTIPGAEELARYIDKFKFRQALGELPNIKKEWGIE